MSFHINSDKEKIRGTNPKLIGDNEATIRVGSGANEREVFRAELDVQSGLPRICLLYTSPSPRDGLLSRMPSSA